MNKIETQHPSCPVGCGLLNYRTWPQMVSTQAPAEPDAERAAHATSLRDDPGAQWDGSMVASTHHASVTHQDRASSTEDHAFPPGVIMDDVDVYEQIRRSPDSSGFRQRIWVNRHPSENTVNELWIDTLQGPRRVVYLSDTC